MQLPVQGVCDHYCCHAHIAVDLQVKQLWAAAARQECYGGGIQQQPC
jgi:hypothetical protein